MNCFPMSWKEGDAGESMWVLYSFGKPPQAPTSYTRASGWSRLNDPGTKPENAGTTGVMPSARILASILFCREACLSIHPRGSGPPCLLTFPMRCHGRNAGPVKKSSSSVSETPRDRHTFLQTASSPVSASGIEIPWSAIQSISRSQRFQFHQTVVYPNVQTLKYCR